MTSQQQGPGTPEATNIETTTSQRRHSNGTAWVALGAVFLEAQGVVLVVADGGPTVTAVPSGLVLLAHLAPLLS